MKSSVSIAGFIPAAGFGKRMNRLTESIPKPLLPVGGLPLIYYSLFLLHELGVKKIYINVYYRKDDILKELEKYPLAELIFSEEEHILGTAGGMRTALGGNIMQHLVTVNPDSIFQMDEYFDPFQTAEEMKRHNCRTLLFLQKKPKDSDETAFLYDESKASDLQQISRTSEGNHFYTGLSVVYGGILSDIALRQKWELGEIWKKEEMNGHVCGRILNGRRIDCGEESSYLQNRNMAFHSDRWKEFLIEAGIKNKL